MHTYSPLAGTLSSGEEAQRAVGEETRNSKRLKTKHTHKKNTTTSNINNNDNNELENTKNSKEKHTKTRLENPQEHLENTREKNVNGGHNGNEDNDGGKKRQEALGNMEKIEKEFTDLKEKFFKDKIGQLKKEVDTIKNGMSPLPTQTHATATSTGSPALFMIFCSLFHVLLIILNDLKLIILFNMITCTSMKEQKIIRSS